VKINVAKSAGFCFGVRRALKIALEVADSKACVYMLGDIVHNEDVVRDIEKSGIKKIKTLHKTKSKILLIRAHGTSKDILNKAKKLGYKIIDATCPMVKEIHKIVKKQEEKGYKIIIIGDKNHDEVKGIAGQLKGEALVIDNVRKIPASKFKKIKKAAVIVQSTQNIENVTKIVNKLNPLINELKFFNTICSPTSIKQKEARTLASKNDIMIIIGSKASANTKRLYEISKSINKKTYWLNSKRDIKPEWFRNVKSVGITAGASTPDSTTTEVVENIRNIT